MAPVRWGILSTAHINRKLLAGAALSSEVEVVAVGSRDLARARAFADEHGIPAAYGSYEELLADPAVEAIYNPLPNTMHCEWSIRALEAGKHVLCEKPMSSSVAEVEEAFAAAERTGFLLTRGVHVPPPPAGEASRGARRRGRDRRAARDPQHLQLRALRRVEHPPAHRCRRRRADGRRAATASAARACSAASPKRSSAARSSGRPGPTGRSRARCASRATCSRSSTARPASPTATSSR